MRLIKLETLEKLLGGGVRLVLYLKKDIFRRQLAYSGDSGHLFRAKAATLRSEATLGIFFVP